MFNKIDYEKPSYNENVLTEDFTFKNTKLWTLTLGAGTGASVESSTEEYFCIEKSLRITHPQYDLSEITFRPTTSTDYAFTIARTGNYIFSFKCLLPGNTSLPELVGEIRFYVNGGDSPYATIPFNIGNNSLPLSSFAYNAWQTFYEEITFTEGQVITLSINLKSDPTWTPGYLKFFLDAFKLEYLKDKDYSQPTIYSLPIN